MEVMVRQYLYQMSPSLPPLGVDVSSMIKV
jgi:hypothetical protein